MSSPEPIRVYSNTEQAERITLEIATALARCARQYLAKALVEFLKEDRRGMEWTDPDAVNRLMMDIARTPFLEFKPVLSDISNVIMGLLRRFPVSKGATLLMHDRNAAGYACAVPDPGPCCPFSEAIVGFFLMTRDNPDLLNPYIEHYQKHKALFDKGAQTNVPSTTH